jgi:hypothetical protein
MNLQNIDPSTHLGRSLRVPTPFLRTKTSGTVLPDLLPGAGRVIHGTYKECGESKEEKSMGINGQERFYTSS